MRDSTWPLDSPGLCDDFPLSSNSSMATSDLDLAVARSLFPMKW